jgi:hypothetical protein
MGDKSKKKVKGSKEKDLKTSSASTKVIGEEEKKQSKVKSSAPPKPTAPETTKSDDGKAKKGKSKEGKSDCKRKRDSVDVSTEDGTPIETEGGVNVQEDVEPVKKKRKKDRKSKSDEQSEKKGEKAKKGDESHEEIGNDEENPLAVNANQDNKAKKEKKSKKQAEAQDRPLAGDGEIKEATERIGEEGKESEKAQKEKKKKRKHKHQTGDVKRVDANAAAYDREEVKAEQKDGKKDKKKKDKKKHKKRKSSEASEAEPDNIAPTPALPCAPQADLSERWNVQALGGGAKRQDKFMRLLGGKKHGANAPAAGEAKESRKRFDIGRVEQELEQQYDAGIRMKFENPGQRRGLGA